MEGSFKQQTPHRLLVGLALAVGLGGSSACGGNDAPAPQVNVELFGWTNEAGQGDFVRDLVDYPGAAQLDVKLTQPRDRRVLATNSAPIVEGSATFPEMSFGENLRLDFDIIDQSGNRVATGATPIFDSGPDASDIDAKVMLSPVRQFAPVGARYTVDVNAGTWEYQNTKFDDRANPDKFLGRVGHEAVPTSRGNVLVVGGGQVAPGAQPDAFPDLTGVLGDLQLFQQNSGYTSDLAINAQTAEEQPDRLNVPRAHHTVTPIGDDRYLVVGGFTRESGSTTATGAIEMIDLRADPGSRVNQLIGTDGEPLTLNKPRGFHTATYRGGENANHVVVTGGVGAGPSDVTSSIEIIDLKTRSVIEAEARLAKARAEHKAVLMGDGTQAIWILGGRSNSEGALAATEMLHLRGTEVTSEDRPAMETARYEMGVARISGKIVVVCGGYTSTDNQGAPTRSCQIGNMDQEKWAGSWDMGEPRGGLSLVEMSQSDDLVVLGGKNLDSDTVETASIFKFRGASSMPPYTLQEEQGTMYRKRYGATVTPMSNGLILLTGGMGPIKDRTAPLPSLEYYNPADVVRARPTEMAQ
jgi:hypothetical protein